MTMKNSGLVAALALLVAVVLSPVAGAATYYVDQNNPAAADTNAGTLAAPWKTVTKATQTMVAGDTGLVKEGVYREQLTLKNKGLAGSPITLKGEPFKRVVISGSDAVTGWQQCDETFDARNENFAHIYYADITWKPNALFQDEQPLQKAREPNIGWYVCQGGTTTTMIDAAHLAQPDGFWVGAEIFLWDVNITTQYTKTISASEQASGTITITPPAVWNSTVVPAANSDRYFMMNKFEILDVPGEWAVEDLGGGTFRVYVWPIGGGSPAAQLMEASRRGSRFLVEWGGSSYWTFDNLELRHGLSHGMGGWSSTSLGHFTVQNCSIHHNSGTGIYGRFNEGGLYYRSYIGYNGAGIGTSDKPGGRIEECEVAHNNWDGVDICTSDTTARRNYIHGHWKWGHADNMQSWGGIANLLIEENLILNGGQSYMMEGLDGVTFQGNTILASGAYMLIFGHSNTFHGTVNHNTLCWPGYGIASLTGDGYHFDSNLIVMGKGGSAWGSGPTKDYLSDYNLFYHADGKPLTSPPVIWNGSYNLSFSQYVQQSGRDTHSQYAAPLFTNAPYAYFQLAYGKNNDFSRSRIYINNSGDMGLIAVGDHVEVDFDGVVRTVTAKGSNYVEVDPAEDRFANKYSSMVNWREKTDYRLDLSLRPGSPAIGRASDGTNVGSRINVWQFQNGDFNGDGYRDIPSWPWQSLAAASQLTQWELLATHGPAGEQATVLADDSWIESRAAVSKLRLTFDQPLDADLVGPGSVTVTGLAHGDLTSSVAGLLLSPDGKTITVTLAAPLPDADRYTVTLAATVQAAGGGPVTGAKSRQVAVLAGDVTGDGRVDTVDLLAMRSRVGLGLGEAGIRYDLNCSGTIDNQDFKALRAALGHTLP